VPISSVIQSPHDWCALYRRDDGEQQPISPVERELGAESFGRRHGLEMIRELVEGLGHPHLRYPVVHVGGSKGKGSTVAILSSILHAAGYRVGTYTSPSLTHFGERIQVNGRPISDAETERYLERLRPLWRDLEERPKFFEATTAIAFEHFAAERVDVAVVEVGLGG
jgi:dihydrofolate synthase/folylpolyglutamate synthase